MQEAKKDAKENVKESIKEGASGAIDKIFESDEEEAIAKAKEQYEILKSQGLEMSNGPCLSNEIIPDWVADVAHDPREDIDDLPENQCPAYGINASHFVEVDPVSIQNQLLLIFKVLVSDEISELIAYSLLFKKLLLLFRTATYI